MRTPNTYLLLLTYNTGFIRDFRLHYTIRFCYHEVIMKASKYWYNLF